MIEAGGMALVAVAPPADGPPQSQSRAAQRGAEPFERAMARARDAEERGGKPLKAAAEAAPEATEEPQTEKIEKAEATEANVAAAVAPEVAAIIKALIAPQQTQPDRTAEVGAQQEQSLVATVSDVIASFEAPVAALAKARGSVVATEATVAAVTVVEPPVAAEGVAIDGLESVQPEAVEAPIDAAPDEPQPAAVAQTPVDVGSETAALRGPADEIVEPLEVDAARAADAAAASTSGGDLDPEDGERSNSSDNPAPVADVGNELAAPRGADVPTVNIAQPIEAAASSSVSRSSEVTATQPTAEVEAVARPVDMSNAPQLASRLADTVQAAVRTGEHSMRLVLNPPDLGHLDVRVVERPDGVSVSLAAESSDGRELLQQHLPALRAALEARDVRVDRLDVSQGSSAAGLGEANDQPRGRREQQGNERPDWSLAAALDGAAAASGPQRSAATRTRLVDLRA